MSDSLLDTYLHYGTHAARLAFVPDPPVVGGSAVPVLYFWYETDTASSWFYDTSWHQVTGTGSGGSPPNTVSGLALWLKADVGVYKDLGVTPCANNDTVEQWNDQSGNGNHVTQPTAGTRPTYHTAIVNSLPVVHFGGTHCLQRASFALSTFTVLIAFRASGTAGMLYEQSATSNSNPGSFLYGTSNSSIDVNRGSVHTNRNAVANWGTFSDWLVVAHSFDGTHSGHRFVTLPTGVNSMPVNTAGNDPGTGTVTDTLNLGARNNGASLGLTGDLCEVVIYTPVISFANMRAVGLYLANRWNFD